MKNLKKNAKTFLIIIVFSISILNQSFAQHEMGFTVGMSNLLGDFGGGDQERNAITDIDIPSFRFAGGGFFRFNVNPSMGFRIQGMYSQLHSSDDYSENPVRYARGLSSKSPLVELSIIGEVNLLPIKFCVRKNNFSPYFGGGIGGFWINPKIQHRDSPLEELDVEQTYLQYQKKSFGLTLPLSIGLKYKITKSILLSSELMYRLSFGDNIDRYVRQANDEYFFLTFNVSYSICNLNVGVKKIRSRRVKCPKL